MNSAARPTAGRPSIKPTRKEMDAVPKAMAFSLIFSSSLENRDKGWLCPLTNKA
jgi:hypothetical protein